MSTIFNPLDYTIGAEAVGIKREHAEYQARQISRIADYIGNDLVTNSHLTSEFIRLEQKMIIKLGVMMVVQTGLILTFIGFLIKYIGS